MVLFVLHQVSHQHLLYSLSGCFVLAFYIFGHVAHVHLVNEILSKVKNDTLGRGLQGWSS